MVARQHKPIEPQLDPSTGIVFPYAIKDAFCSNCGDQLAWTPGVGHHVITHAHGHKTCSQPTVAELGREYELRADATYKEMNAIYVAHMSALREKEKETPS